jgi:tRNA nucleotidyltransferase (CCA-adding enzyme)
MRKKDMAIRGIYQVGGCVRDAIIGVRSNDIDYVVDCDSYAEMREYVQGRIDVEGGTIFPIENAERFLTIRARVGREVADYVVARRDGAYSDGRRPDEVSIGGIMDDLARRDFTMNAIAMDVDGNYFDPFMGIADIEARIIRCVGDTYERMAEDLLRIIRAARFAITKGFDIDPEISALFDNEYWMDRLVRSVSQDRIRAEVAKMFTHDTVASIAFFGAHPVMAQACFSGGIWLRPTSESR